MNTVIKPKTFIATLGLQLLILSFNTQADKIYKWVDEQGNVHFGSQAPQGHQSIEVKAKNQRPSGKNTPSKAPAAIPQQSATQAEASNATEKTYTSDDQRICEQASNNLKTMKNQPRVRMEESGELKVIAGEEKVKLENKMAALIKEHCKP